MESEDDVSISSMDDRQEPFPVDAKSYRITELIGRGKNAVVYKARCVPMNTDVAIKAFNLDHFSRDFDEAIRLVTATDKVYSVLHHPNLLSSHCTFAVDRKIWVVMPLMAAGSLQSIMSNSFPTGLPEDCIAAILQQILNLLSYLHSNQILHRDLKAGNILLDPKGQVQFASFGVSAAISNLSSSPSSPLRIPETSCSDAPYWVSPEMLYSNDVHSVKSEIWSFGILALELAYGRPPLSDIDQYISPSVTKKINERFSIQNYKNCMESCSSCSDKKTFSESFKDLVKQCLEPDPGNRPMLEMLQKHSFVRSCESSDFLAKSMLHDLPSLEARFKLSIERMGYNYSVGEEKREENEKTRQSRISGWKLNVEKLKLCPTLSSPESNPDHVSQNETETLEERRRLQVQTVIIKEKDVTMEEEDEEKGIVNEIRETMIDRIKDVILGLDTTGQQLDEVDETKTTKEVLLNLISAKSSLEKQLNEIISLIDLHGHVFS